MIKKYFTLGNVLKITFILAVFLLAVLLAPKAYSGFGSEKTYGSNVPRSRSQWTVAGWCLPYTHLECTNTCVPAGALLTGSYYQPALCEANTLSPGYGLPPTLPGGGIFTAYVNSVAWDREFQQLQDMTTQLHSFRISQTQILGTSFDAQSMNKIAQKQQIQEIESRRRYTPNEYSCVAGSSVTAMSKTSAASTAMRKGLKNDLEKRSAGAHGTTSETGARGDHKAKWDEYCAEFHDPSSNNGVSGCPETQDPNEGDESESARLINGDINIEGVLFKDTINMADEHEYKAAKAVLRNLIQPNVRPKAVKASAGTSANRSVILKQQHLEAVRNVATDVVSAIVSRRMSVPSEGKSYIKDIRKKAGVPDDDISENPSYNEIMLALTKERFFDPSYFARVQRHPNSIRQEQAAVGAYINIQMNDLYKLQEQINTLTAARTALKFNSDPKSSQISSAPIQ